MDHTCALLTDLHVKCWGSGAFEQNGYNYTIGDNELPSSIPPINYGNAIPVDISAETQETCLTFNDGTMKCWGYGGDETLGNGTRTNISASAVATTPSIYLGGQVQIPTNISAFFTSNPYFGPSPLQIDFDASKSISLLGAITNYHWNFGDGGVLDSQTAATSYIFYANGVYTSQLTITDSLGQTAIFKRTITVGPVNNPPFAFFNALSSYGVAPYTANFDASNSFDVNGTIAKYSWNFGDEVLLDTTTPITQHIYSAPGTYLAMLKVQDNSGATADAFPMPITVKEFNMSPFASSNCSIAGRKINCSAFSSGDMDGMITNYQWDFGDGLSTQGQSQFETTHSYMADGTFNVKLTIVDDSGATATYQVPVLIDTVAPNIISTLADNVITNDPNFHLSMIVDELNEAETNISQNGVVISTTHDHVIDEIVSLQEGLNVFTVDSIDGTGNKTHKTILSSILLDTAAPQLASISPPDGTEVSSQQIVVTGRFNEQISSLLINDVPATILADGQSFSYNYTAYSEGIHQLSLNASDMAGNSSLVTTTLNVQLKILYPELISISKLATGELKVTGSPGAAKENSEILIAAGMLNRKTVTAKADGSFEATLNYFTSVKVTATDPISGRSESTVINYNVDTTLAGTIKDTDGNPLPGVKVTLKDTDASPVLTNASGIFSFANPPTGDRQLIIDAQNVPVAAVGPNKKFSVLEIPVSIGSRQSNVIDAPIYLAPLMFNGTETVVENGVSTTVESAQVAGAAIEIPGSVQVNFPEGNTLKAINMAEISKDKTTVPVIKEVEPQTVVALEPSGLSFSEPVQLTLPNSNEFPAGMQVMIYSKNSKTGTWEIDGVARVDGNGEKIVTQDGMGITHFSEVYAAPMGLKYSQINSQDKPGADTFNGAVSTTIDFPGYKSMGAEIAPKLIYRSNWAHPTATVTNIFDLPTEVQFIDVDGKRVIKPMIGSFESQTGLTTWAIPEKVNLNYVIGDYHSDVMTLTGIPEKAVVSFGVDLQLQPSGILPFNASYEIHLKRMVIRTDNYLEVANGFRRGFKPEDLISFPEVIPASLTGNLYVQNKSTSKVGKGWMIGGVQKIVNPGSSRLMLEEDSGAVSTYVVDDKIQTILKTKSNFSGINILDNNQLALSDSTDSIYELNLDDGTKSTLLTAPQYSGAYSSSSTYTRNECTTWATVFGKGRICFSWSDRYYCRQSKANYQLTPTKKYSIASPGGTGYIVASEKGVISLHNGNSFEILTGKTKTAPTSDSDPFFCSSSASCTSKTIVNDFRNYPPCPTTPASTGQVYDQGYDDGPLGAARFNTIKSIASNPTANGFAVADYGNHRVRYVNLDTKIVTTIAGSGKVEDTGDGGLAIEAGINHPLGLAYDADGNLFVSNETGYIRKIDKTGHIVKFAGNPNGAFYDQAKAVDMFLSKPYGLTYDVDKNLLYAADSGNNRILKIDLNTNIVKNVAGNGLCQTETSNGEKGGALGASLCNPEFVELDENKNLIIADTGHNMIRRVIFSDSANGILKFDAVADDGSSLVRNSNGSFTRTFRSGVQVNFDGLGKHISTTDRVGRTVFNNYDGTGNLISQIDPVGGIISYEYEFLGGALSKIRYGNDGREFTFNHDNNLNLTSVNYPDGTAKQFSYKPDGLLIGETDQKNNSIAYNYNKWNRLQEVVRPDGNKITVNDSQSVSMVNNYTGGVTGSLKKQGTDSNQLADGIKDAKGITTTFVQDETGYVSTIIDGTGKTTLVARDDKGRPTEITRPDNSKVEFSYDQKTGDLLSKSDSLTKTTEIYIYDSFGNLISRTDGLGRKILIDYDSKGQLIKTTNEILGTSVTYTYNSLGLLSTQTDSLGQASSVIYDSKGNVLKAISPEGKETNYFYYSSGLVQKVTDANATNSQYEYDSMNRLLAVTTGGSQKTQYTYQETGELIQIVDPYSKLTNFYYDNLGQLTKKIGTRGEITELTYDENGNTSSEKTPNGQKKYFYYDNLDQLVRKLLPDDDYNFNYDVRGNVTSVRNLQTQIDFSYQHFDGGDIISQVHSYGIGNGTDLPNTALSYSYNEVGERIGMATPKGTFHYGRDAAGRLRNITNHKGEVFSMKYDLNQRLKEISSPAITTSFTFDSTGFNTQINHARKSGATIEKYIYGKDEVGNRISKTTSSGTSTYSYDKNYQLIKSVTPRLPDENFSYDSVGNRISDSNSTYAYDSSKQEVQEDYKYLYTFDANGNMTSKQEKNFTGNVQNFDYNSENQLRVFKLYKNGQLAREVAYTYDALGRRIEKTILDHEENSKSFTKRFAYDGSEILFELNENNSITQTYTHSTMRTDDPLAVANSQGTFYFVKDGLGSITDITDDSGFKVQHYDYSAFGKILAVKDGNGNDVMDAPPVDQSFSYTGREYDKESGLYYYRARYYDPNIGRFLSVDPDVGSLSNPITHINKYFYVGNNPINLVDPTGMSWKKFTRFATGVAIGSFLGPLGALAGGLILSQSDRAWNNVIKFAGSSEGQALIIITAGILTGGVAGVVLTGALLNANDTRRSKGGWKAVLTSAAIGGAVSYLGAGLVPSNFFGAAIVGAGIGYIGSVLTGGNMEGHVRAAEAGGASAAISNATAPPSNEGTGGSCYSFGLLDHSKPGCK
jgi:RHS repeat-associated protein